MQCFANANRKNGGIHRLYPISGANLLSCSCSTDLLEFHDAPTTEKKNFLEFVL